MDKLYAYRGWILGLLAVIMLLLPGAEMSSDWLCEALPMSAVVFVAFVVLRILARRTIGEHTRGFTHDADRLVTDGVYSRIRHPLYLSNAGIGYAFVILHFGFDLVALPFVLLLFSFEFLLSRMEDRYLENRFGDEWRQWAAVTPAFFGWGSGFFSDKPKMRSFGATVRADVSTWIWLVVVIAIIVLRKTILTFNIFEVFR